MLLEGLAATDSAKLRERGPERSLFVAYSCFKSYEDTTDISHVDLFVA